MVVCIQASGLRDVTEVLKMIITGLPLYKGRDGHNFPTPKSSNFISARCSWTPSDSLGDWLFVFSIRFGFQLCFSPPLPSIPRWIPHLVSHSQRCNPQRFCNYEIANTLQDWFEKCIKKEGIADIFSTKVGLGGGDLWRLLCLLPSIIHLRPIWDRKTICTLLQSKLLCNLSQGL